MKEVNTCNTEKISNTEKKSSDKKAIIVYLQEKYKPQKGINLIVKHLWGKNYRLNFWIIKKQKGSTVTEGFIEESKFIQVDNTPDGYISEELKEKGG